MNKQELLFVVAQCLQEHLPLNLKEVSVDGDGNTSEIIIDTNDGDSYVIRSERVEETVKIPFWVMVSSDEYGCDVFGPYMNVVQSAEAIKRLALAALKRKDNVIRNYEIFQAETKEDANKKFCW
jgi:hypothetical protein